MLREVAQQQALALPELEQHPTASPPLRLLEPTAVLPTSCSRVLWLALGIGEQDEAIMQRVVQSLFAYSSQISRPESHTMLVELGGSLRFFAGRQGHAAKADEAVSQLQQRITTQLLAMGLAPAWAIAPTPLAAQWLAQHRPGTQVLQQERLRTVLAELSTKVLTAWYADLQRLGLQTLADVWRLPRAGLARRLQPQLLIELDKALGLLADPQRYESEPLGFEEQVAIEPEQVDQHSMQPELLSLLSALASWLQQHGLCVRQFELRFLHRQQAATLCPVRFARPLAHAQKLEAHVPVALERLVLAAPVCQIVLIADQFEPQQWQNDGCLAEQQAQNLWYDTLERVQARLRAQPLQGLQCRDEHRPELAWQSCEPGHGHQPQALAVTPRPLWLLKTPHKLSADTQRAPLRLLSRPERIVSGWWDDDAIARDYFMALQADGRKVWLFRCEAGWFVHGYFA